MPPRNLVVIVADTLRDPRPLSAPDAPLMPFLEAFARKGRQIPRLLASSSWTAPSHVSLLTGVDPWETHFEVPGAPRLPPRAESLADKWAHAGGDTAAFSANFVVTPTIGTAVGYAHFNPGFASGPAGRIQMGLQFLGYERMLYWAIAAGHAGSTSALERVGASAIEWGGTSLSRALGTMRSGGLLLRSLRRFLHERRGRSSAPLHLFFNLVEAHEPYLYGDNGGRPAGGRNLAHLPSISLARLNDALAPHGDPATFREVYRASLPVLDQILEKIVATLQRSGVLDNAVLVFLSDHGQSLGEQGFYGHGFFLFDELVKVPGFVWEFQGGRPVPLPSFPEEWVDHRHVFDLLSSITPDGAPVDPEGVLGGSLVRRGPASSYYEGPLPRPPSGFMLKVPRSEVYRMLRVQAGDAGSMAMSDGAGGNIRTVPTHSSDATSPELTDIAHQILSQIQAVPTSVSPEQAKLDAAVDARLKSWGYD